jgi:hypothetical protein
MTSKADKIIKEIVISVIATTILVSGCWIWNSVSSHHVSAMVMWGVVSFEAGICVGKIQEFLRA